jgi:hypothetical protein
MVMEFLEIKSTPGGNTYATSLEIDGDVYVLSVAPSGTIYIRSEINCSPGVTLSVSTARSLISKLQWIVSKLEKQEPFDG